MHRPNPAILGCPFCSVHVHHYHACSGSSEEKPVVLMPCGYCLAYRRSLLNMLLDNFMTFPECACSVCHCRMDPGDLNAVLHPLQGNDFIHGIRNFFRNRQQPTAAHTGAGPSSTGNGQPAPAVNVHPPPPTQVVDVDTPPTADPPIVIDVDPPTEDEADPAPTTRVNVDEAAPPRTGASTSARGGSTPSGRSRRKASVPRRFLQRPPPPPPPPSNPKKTKRIPYVACKARASNFDEFFSSDDESSNRLA